LCGTGSDGCVGTGFENILSTIKSDNEPISRGVVNDPVVSESASAVNCAIFALLFCDVTSEAGPPPVMLDMSCELVLFDAINMFVGLLLVLLALKSCFDRNNLNDASSFTPSLLDLTGNGFKILSLFVCDASHRNCSAGPS
jgi:hypothetical protein